MLYTNIYKKVFNIQHYKCFYWLLSSMCSVENSVSIKLRSAPRIGMSMPEGVVPKPASVRTEAGETFLWKSPEPHFNQHGVQGIECNENPLKANFVVKGRNRCGDTTSFINHKARSRCWPSELCERDFQLGL